jgi:hypothetical protein
LVCKPEKKTGLDTTGRKGNDTITIDIKQVERDHQADQDIGGWIILRWILERWDGVMWTGFVWFRIGTSG